MTLTAWWYIATGLVGGDFFQPSFITSFVLDTFMSKMEHSHQSLNSSRLIMTAQGQSNGNHLQTWWYAWPRNDTETHLYTTQKWREDTPLWRAGRRWKHTASCQESPPVCVWHGNACCTLLCHKCAVSTLLHSVITKGRRCNKILEKRSAFFLAKDCRRCSWGFIAHCQGGEFIAMCCSDLRDRRERGGKSKADKDRAAQNGVQDRL